MESTVDLSGWRKFVQTLPPALALRNIILASWSRSHQAGIDPEAQTLPLRRIPDEDLARRLVNDTALLSVARPHLDWLRSYFAAVPHIAYLVDRDGIVLYSAGNTPEMMERFGLRPGYDWSERAMGTNGAGTALAANRAVAVVGPEHFMRVLDDCTCTGAPIHDEHGMVIGAIDISTSVADGSPERLVLVRDLAQMIEQQLASFVRPSHTTSQLEQLVESRTTALLKTYAALTKSQRELRALAHQLLTIQDQERARISRELHDSVSQEMATVAIRLDLLGPRLQPDQDHIREELERTRSLVSSLAEHIREFSHQLHPAQIDQLGLVQALEAYVKEFSKLYKIDVRFSSHDVPDGLSPEVTLTLYRVAQEWLRNVAKHADADSVILLLRGVEKGLRLSIRDNGRGFDAKAARAKNNGLGIVSMEERLRSVNGRLLIRSQPGEGARLVARIPLTSPEPKTR